MAIDAHLQPENEMDETRKQIAAIAREEAAKNQSDIEAAVASAVAKARKLPEFSAFVDSLVRTAISGMVHDARHSMNCQIKANAGQFGGKAKVVASASRYVQEAIGSLYNLMIAGRTLGELTGDELLPLAATERATASGYIRRAALLEKLRPLVPDGKTVKQAVKVGKLQSLWIATEADGVETAA